MSETIRLNLDISESQKSKLVALKERTDAASLTEVFRRSLSLYELAIAHCDSGGQIILESKDGVGTRVAILT